MNDHESSDIAQKAEGVGFERHEARLPPQIPMESRCSSAERPFRTQTIAGFPVSNRLPRRLEGCLFSQPGCTEYDQSLQPDIVRMAGLERKTVYSHLDPLLAYGIVEKSRTVGNSTMCQINTDNEAAKALGKFDHELVQILAAKEDAGELDKDRTPIVAES